MRIGRQAFKGSLWLGSFIYAKQAISFGVQIVLARLLLPSDFGQYAILSSILELTFIIANISTVEAIVKYQYRDDIFATSWKICLRVSAILSFVFILSLIVFRLLGVNTETLIIIAALFLARVIRLPTSILEVWIEKDLRYKYVSLSMFGTTAFGSLVGVLAAVYGLGIWSLVLKELVESLLYYFLMENYNKSNRNGDYNKVTANLIIKYGIKLIGARLMDVLYTRSPVILIGWHSGIQNAGFFERGYYLADVQNTVLNPIANRVLRSVYGKIQNSKDKVGEALYWHIFISARWSFPIALMLFLFSDQITIFLLGDQWLVAGSVVEGLAIWIALQSTCTAIEVCILTLGTPFVLTVSRSLSVVGVVVGFLVGYLQDQWIYVVWSFSLSVILRFVYLQGQLNKLNVNVNWFSCLLLPTSLTFFLLLLSQWLLEELNLSWWEFGGFTIIVWLSVLIYLEKDKIKVLAARLME
ncbi:MAG: oligosaccharide flippase family protein [Sedimenticola sp.]